MDSVGNFFDKPNAEVFAAQNEQQAVIERQQTPPPTTDQPQTTPTPLACSSPLPLLYQFQTTPLGATSSISIEESTPTPPATSTTAEHAVERTVSAGASTSAAAAATSKPTEQGIGDVNVGQLQSDDEYEDAWSSLLDVLNRTMVMSDDGQEEVFHDAQEDASQFAPRPPSATTITQTRVPTLSLSSGQAPSRSRSEPMSLAEEVEQRPRKSSLPIRTCPSPSRGTHNVPWTMPVRVAVDEGADDVLPTPLAPIVMPEEVPLSPMKTPVKTGNRRQWTRTHSGPVQPGQVIDDMAIDLEQDVQAGPTWQPTVHVVSPVKHSLPPLTAEEIKGFTRFKTVQGIKDCLDMSTISGDFHKEVDQHSIAHAMEEPGLSQGRPRLGGQ